MAYLILWIAATTTLFAGSSFAPPVLLVLGIIGVAYTGRVVAKRDERLHTLIANYRDQFGPDPPGFSTKLAAGAWVVDIATGRGMGALSFLGIAGQLGKMWWDRQQLSPEQVAAIDEIRSLQAERPWQNLFNTAGGVGISWCVRWFWLVVSS